MTRYFKAVRPDGLDFHSRTVDYAGALASGETLTHPDGRRYPSEASHYFSVATVATDCTGMSWPCRLLVVEPVGDVWTPAEFGMPNTRACVALRVVEEVDAHLALGPQGAQFVDLIGQAARLTASQANDLHAARDAARAVARDAAGDAAGDAARAVARDAALDAARDAARAAARDAARDAARALVVRDLISQHGFTQNHYDTLTGPWRKVIGRIHPDDTDLREVAP